MGERLVYQPLPNSYTMAIPNVIKNLLSDAADHGRAHTEYVRLADYNNRHTQLSSYNLSDATAPQVSSYAGSDILCTIYVPSHSIQGSRDPGFIEVEDQLQTITVSSARSVMPVRRLGETNPASYARGSRTIAGSMVFTTGLRDAFVKMLAKSYKDGEPRREPTLFVDQIPQFSMVFQAANELGGVSTAMLGNITLTNFGTTFSIDDIYTESTFTYVADQYFPIAEYGDKQFISKSLRAVMGAAIEDTVEALGGHDWDRLIYALNVPLGPYTENQRSRYRRGAYNAMIESGLMEFMEQVFEQNPHLRDHYSMGRTSGDGNNWIINYIEDYFTPDIVGYNSLVNGRWRR